MSEIMYDKRNFFECMPDKIDAAYFDIGDGRCIILKDSIINTENSS